MKNATNSHPLADALGFIRDDDTTLSTAATSWTSPNTPSPPTPRPSAISTLAEADASIRVPSPRPGPSIWHTSASCTARRIRLSHLEAWISQIEGQDAAQIPRHPRPSPLTVISVRYEIQSLRAWLVQQADADDAEAVDNVTLADEETAVPVLRVHAPTPVFEASASRPVSLRHPSQSHTGYAAALPRPPTIVTRAFQPRISVTSGPSGVAHSSSLKRKPLDTVDGVDAEFLSRGSKRVRK